MTNMITEKIPTEDMELLLEYLASSPLEGYEPTDMFRLTDGFLITWTKEKTGELIDHVNFHKKTMQKLTWLPDEEKYIEKA